MLKHWTKFFLLFTFSFTYANILIDSDGGYTNIVVGINPKVPNSKIQLLLFELENLFKNSSQILKEATKGKVYFKEVIFTFPKKYKSDLEHLNWKNGKDYFEKSDFIITADDVFQKAYTIQNEGCGSQGLKIHLPEEFVFKSGGNKGKDLVRAWSKYRYGVFDESGFPGDDLYPACYSTPGTETIKVTDCTNQNGLYDIRKSATSLSKDCKPIALKGKNDAIISSLMSNIDFPKMKMFCDDSKLPHNREVPSKQNALCQEQSTWKVISDHTDFQFQRKQANFNLKETTFKYVLESDNKLFLAVDTSIEMIINDRWDVIKNAFSYFLLNNLPGNSTVGLINLKDIEENPSLVTVETQPDAERLIDMFPETSGEGNICVHCGIEKVVQILKRDFNSSGGVVVIGTTTDVHKSYLKYLEDLLTNNFVTLHVIYFKTKLKEPPLLQKLVSKVDGKFFYIVEDIKSVSSLTQLYEAFRVIYESFSWMNQNHVLVDQATFSANECLVCSLSFSTDESMESLQVLITGPQFLAGPPVVKNKLILSSKNQSLTLRNTSYSYKIKIPAYTFSMKQPQPGEWSLSFQRKPEFYEPIVVIVRASSSKFNDIVHMKTWIKNKVNENDSILTKPPIALYAEIKRGNSPLENASVTATLYEVDTGTQLSLNLLDSGDGDPDITSNDGIFSRYFTHAPKGGYYMLTMKVEVKSSETELFRNTAKEIKHEYCCGSSYPPTTLYNSGQLVRVVNHGSIYIPDRNLGIEFSPRRIADLRVEKLVPLENGVTCYALKWTAPGDNYDYKTAKDYQLRVFRHRDDALKNFDGSYVFSVSEWNIHGSILTPHSPGTIESAIVELKNLTKGIYYLAMRTVGFSGKISDVSNVVEIFYVVPIIPPTSLISTETGYTDNGRTGTPGIAKQAEALSLEIAISIAAGILFILLIIGIAILIYMKIKIKKQNSDNKPETQKTESNDTLCDGKETGNISVISPVNSWPANSLLSHYESNRSRNPDVCNVPMAHRNTEDTVSTTSTKSSYNIKYHTNHSLDDNSYFINNYKDDINYPFNPIYTSSLQHFPDERASNEISPYTVSYYSTLDSRGSHRLRTDV